MSKKYIRKVVKNGRNSYYINIPKEIARELKIRERQKLVIKRRGSKIVIEDWER
ncbi:AbrB/MazE/SpoVT family DNA-binding domain-containing protein [bacterium]|nr:AbrB/MazE/SpoVT family DNA-binding domain-containing protein [bacterium]